MPVQRAGVLELVVQDPGEHEHCVLAKAGAHLRGNLTMVGQEEVGGQQIGRCWGQLFR